MSRDNDNWLAALKAREDRALANLRDLLLRNLRRALSGRPRADQAFLEDVVQESLLRILDRLDQFQGRSRFDTWATTIAVRIAMTQLRRGRWKDVSLEAVLADGSQTYNPAADETLGPEARVQWHGIVATLHRLIDSDLTEKQRTALLAELKGMPQDEIARHLVSNRNAVYKITHDARKKLKRGLESAGYTAGDVVAVN